MYPPGQLVTDYCSSFMDAFVNTQIIKMSGRKRKKNKSQSFDEFESQPKGEVGTVGAVAM